MEKMIITGLKSAIEKFICCKVSILHSNQSDIPSVEDEHTFEIRTNANSSVNECALIQNIPLTIKNSPTSPEKIFIIKNLDSGKEIDMRNENKKQFIEEFSSVTEIDKNYQSLIIFYRKKQTINQRCWEAIENNDVDTIKKLLSSKVYGNLMAEANARGENDETALHIASRIGNLKVIQAIADCGQVIDINAKNIHGLAAIHIACKYGHYLAVQFLIRSRVIWDISDNYGNNPLHYAVESGNHKLIKYLIHQFPDLDKKNQEGITPTEILKRKRIEISIENIAENLNLTKSSEIQATDPLKLSAADFEAIQVLGKGSFGEVYLVKMLLTGKLYAMKILQKQKIIDQNQVKYIYVERNILTYINHPFIVKLHYAFQSVDKLYLVLDYCSGGNLTYYLAKERHFTEEIAKIYLCEIILALEELHKNGIIYRDLKPDNIVLDGEGHALLIDFGLSKQGINENSAAMSFCGSVAYLAPEMVKRIGHGKVVDWYLLGVLLYEMLIGFPPFYSTNREQLIRNIESAKVIIPDRISTNCRDLIKKLLKRNPLKRIGYHKDAAEIKSHPFFANIDWESALRRELMPPLIPKNSITPAYVPKFYTKEKQINNEKLRYLHNWTFIAD